MVFYIMGLFKRKSEEEKITETLTKYNIFEGIDCEVIFPDTQLKIVSHSGLTGGVATLAFGFVGLAATSSIKHKEEKRKLNLIFRLLKRVLYLKEQQKMAKT